jgi:hypothetical protein
MAGMKTRSRFRFAILIALAALGLPGTAPTASAADVTCVLLLPDGGGVLVNRCDTCREVTLERMRVGEGIPNIREMMLPGEAMTPMPFRGPGRTRILGERACPPVPGRIAQQASASR